ncbi:hypothetical protein IKG12_01325 [Candidatus Saccharibacteria bacterium]|nr:hypothetical protein [Candidatus Saccharibacteria bacterium]MBR3233488.1 hypothetical protein [Candidatus Saccharibacteria bacterium]
MHTLTTGATTLTEREATAAAAGGLIGGLFAVLIAFYIFMIIAGWKIFTKAGEKGWKSLIPIYNVYVMLKISGMKNWFWALLGVSVVASILLVVFKFDTNALYDTTAMEKIDWGNNIPALIILLAEGIFEIIMAIIYCRNTAKVFGKGTGFAVCLFFFTPIVWLVLGFGNAKYDKKALKALKK